MADQPPTEPQAPTTRASIQGARRKAVKRKHRWRRRTILTLTTLVVVLAVLVVGLYIYSGYRFDQIKKGAVKHLVKDPPPGKPFNVLLVGSDSRAFVGNNQSLQNAFGNAGSAGGQRSDVTMVARFVPATRQIYLLSIPRDLWVDIPGDGPEAGMNRINAAFNNGPSLLIETIEKDLQIPINHYVYVDFSGFQNMVNALGGVSMNFPDEVRDQYSGLDVTTMGCQMVNGTTALELVRSRHMYYLDSKSDVWEYDGLSDFSRIRRQDALFRALMDKVGGELANPLTINAFFGAAVHSLAIDNTITHNEVLRWAFEFQGVNQNNLHTFTLPTVSDDTAGGASVLDEAQPYANNLVFTFNLVGEPQVATPGKHKSHSTLPAIEPPAASTGSTGSSSTTTTTPSSTFSIGASSGPAPTSSTTTTSIPGDVYTNEQPEPWNPVPCTQ
jgi:LCP family protein required for cell wall assembly